MSYILDALKRAESERERGSVPGLHSQSVPLRRPVAESQAVAKPLVWAGTALALALLALFALLAWRWSGLAPVETGAGLPDVSASSALTRQAAVSAPATPAASAITVVAPVPERASTAVPESAPPAKAVVAGSALKPRVSVVSPKPGPQPQPAGAVAATPVPNSARILPVSELPADVRQTLPKVVISGSTYSDNQALRMLIINGEVFREGEKPAPGLQLEQITAKSAILNFKGLRYSMAY